MGHKAPLFVHFWSEFDVPLRCESFDGAKGQWSGVAGTMEEALEKKNREMSPSVIFRVPASDCVHLRYSGSAISDSLLYHP